ncbi:MAG TPA: PAS domain S-box protein [Bacteroidales bacterium]
MKKSIKTEVASLAKSEERFRSTLENLLEGCQIIDFEYRYIFINKVASEQGKKTAEELHGHTMMEMYPGIETTPMFSVLQQCMKDRVPRQMGNEFNFDDGTNGWFHLSFEPVPEGVFIMSTNIIDRKQAATELAIANKELTFQITERKKAEKALQESEERFRNLYGNSTVGIYRTTPDGKIIFANSTLVKLLRYSSFEELSERNLEKDGFEPSYDRTYFMDVLKREGEVKGLESTWIRMDGTTLFVSESARAVYDSDGKILYYDGTVQNITEQKQTMEALNKTQHLYKTLTAVSPVGIFRTDPDGKTTFVNPKWLEMSGLTFEEAIGFGWLKAVHPNDKEKLKEGWFSDNKSQKPSKAEYRFLRPDGSIVWVMGNAEPEIIDNEIVSYVGTLTDITGRKQGEVDLKNKIDELTIANKAILQSEINFHRSIFKSPIGIRIVSTDGKTIYANKAFLAIFELNSLKEFTSIKAINLYTPESYAQHQKRKEKRNNGYDVFDYEISIICANAGIRHIKIWRREVMWNGTKHYQVINLDITEQKKLTMDLIAAKEKAEESDRLKTAFLQNMSHEIRTPLNAILGFSELLQDTTSSQEDIRFYLEQINFGKDDLLELIENVVFASKIDTKQIISVKKEFNLNDSLNNLISNSKKLLKRKDKSHLDFLTHIESTQNITIEADENNLNIALYHLIDNAIKYTDFGGIEIGTKLIENSEVEFYIRDTGIGIDKSEFEKIFDKFYKVESNQNKLFRGAGIGLTIVKGIAEAFGGKAWINSIVDEGSTFYFSIPVNVVKSKLKHYEPEEDISILVENWGERNILISEDVDINLKYLDKVLDFRNITRFHAKNGKEAVEIIKTVKIDLVLMDILMPVMDGYEASTIIKTMFPSVPIIAQTAIYYNHNNKDSNLLDLFNDYIVKPISPDTLIKVLDRFLKLNK